MLVLCPLHSVTSPAVGLGYLRSHLESEGYATRFIDLNIALHYHLRASGLTQSFLSWIFPYGERTFGGEALLSAACFGMPPNQILKRAADRGVRSLTELLERINLRERMQTEEAQNAIKSVQMFLESWAAKIASKQMDWIGFSVIATNQAAVIYLSRRIKELSPSTRIVLGGPHFHQENALAWVRTLPEIEAVIIGDGRASLVSWLKGECVHNDPQIATSDSNQKRIAILAPKTSKPHWLAADWSGVDWSQYHNILEDNLHTSGRTPSRFAAIPVLGARGCSYNRCKFCYEVLLAPARQERPVSDVADEVAFYKRSLGASSFFFTDLDFNADYDRTVELCEILQRITPDIRFHCWLRAHSLDYRLLQALYDAGCRTWFVGIESVSDNPLRLMGKGYDGKHAREVIKLMSAFVAKRPDVRYGFNLLPGYPGETLNDVLETFAFVESNLEHFRGRVAALYSFALTTNTIAWRQRNRLGVRQLVGWNEIQFPEALGSSLPSFRFWHELDDSEADEKELIWDHIRLLVGHRPQYLRAA